MKRRAIVTGGTGYLGGALTVRLLEMGWVPTLLVRATPTAPRPGVEYLDIGMIHASESNAFPEDVTAVFHLAAAQPGADLSDQLAATLVLGSLTQRLVRAQAFKPTIVFAGSYWQDAAGPHGVGPIDGYAVAKEAFSALARSGAAHDGVPHVLLHIGDVFGPDDDRPKLVPQVLAAVHLGTRVAATSGEQMVSYVHREDVVDALLIAAMLHFEACPPVVEYSVAGPRFEPLREVFRVVERARPQGLPIDWGVREQKGRFVEQVVGPARLPGWSPSRTLLDFFERELDG